jgi:adenylosuccinate synthase
MSRTGIRMADLLDKKIFREKLRANLSTVNYLLKRGSGGEGFKIEKIYAEYMKCAEYLAPFITDTITLINKFIDKGKNVLFEGAQGTLLDVDHGTYPFVTSSNASVGGVCTGLGVSPTKIDGVLGVMKAYTTRVGGGPFPTELKSKLGETLRSRGGEYGATTGRPRRCGWLDAVGLRHAVKINDFTGIALTKLDVLDELDKIKICIAYRHKNSYKNTTQRLTEMPQNHRILEECEPIYKEFDGWKKSTQGITRLRDLPKQARAYIEYIEELLNVRIDLISTGQRREEAIILRDPLRDYKRGRSG